jgi:hypothetical protein
MVEGIVAMGIWKSRVVFLGRIRRLEFESVGSWTGLLEANVDSLKRVYVACSFGEGMSNKTE